MLSAGKEQTACQLKWEEGEDGLMRFMISCLIPVEEGNESAKAAQTDSLTLRRMTVATVRGLSGESMTSNSARSGGQQTSP